MEHTVRVYEELSLNAHPAFELLHYDGWVLRFAGGYTHRANSVNMLSPSMLPFAEKIAYCEEIYRGRGLSTVFKLLPGMGALDAELEKGGYRIVTPTSLMTAAIPQMELPTVKASEVEITSGVGPEWQTAYFRLAGIAEVKIPIATQLQNSIRGQVLCALIRNGGDVLACGLCVVEREYAGLYDIVVSPLHRRQGYGYAVCTSLIKHAVEYGAKTAYLQVVAENEGAAALYRKMGFMERYHYWYRVKR